MRGWLWGLMLAGVYMSSSKVFEPNDNTKSAEGGDQDRRGKGVRSEVRNCGYGHVNLSFEGFNHEIYLHQIPLQ